MNLKYLVISPVFAILSACQSMQSNSPDSQEWIYPVGMESTPPSESAPPLPTFVKTAEAPQIPNSAKNMDISWIQQQNPQDYTIQVASSTKPLLVSQSLLEMPKNQHAAAIKYQVGSSIYYTGVYGNYSDLQSAEETLKQLPEHLKKESRVIQWSSIQHLQYL